MIESEVVAAPLEAAPPEALGFDPVALSEAIDYAKREAETPWPRELAGGLGASGLQEKPPWNEVLGPTRSRQGPNGLLLREGCVVGSWGDVHRADMTFSVAKSYLALLAGVALGDGLIRDLDDPIRGYGLDDGYDTEQNRGVTWRHMLHQTSEWEGTLWSKPDLVDRNRQVGRGADNSRKGTHRPLRSPGTYWEYNDVRVNRLSLSLMQLFRRPLPEILRRRIMDPIGCSNTWEWHGYRNSWIDVGGESMQAVPGGSHWGGGLWIASIDHARVGQLMLGNGAWRGRRILPVGWVDEIRRPCPSNRQYGLLWWLNTDRSYLASAPPTSYFAIGAGGHVIWVEPDLKLVMVARWIDSEKVDNLIGKILASLV